MEAVSKPLRFHILGIGLVPVRQGGLNVQARHGGWIGSNMFGSEAAMCSNFGLNLHPDRKPCALQWQWYNFFSKLRKRFFPKALYMCPGDARAPRPGAAKDGSRRRASL